MKTKLLSVLTAIAATFAAADTWYVTPDGAGSGNNSATPASLQTAINSAGSGDFVILQSGVYALTAQIEVAEKDIKIIGGYDAEWALEESGESVITKDASASAMRLFNISASDVSFENIVFTGGNVGSGNAVYSTDSDLSFIDCVLTNNLYTAGGGNGGAICATGGSLTISDTLIANNGFGTGSDNLLNGRYGGALYAKNVDLVIDSSTFATNRIRYYYGATFNGGGALYLNGGSAKITNTDFLGNHIWRRGDDGTSFPYHNWTTIYGGTLYAVGLSSLEFSDCKFIGGFSNFQHNDGSSRSCGLMWLEGADMAVSMNRCVINGVGYRYGLGSGWEYTISASWDNGSITLASGTLGMTNVVVSGGRGPIIEIANTSSAKLYADKCTFTGATTAKYGISVENGISIENGYAIFHNGAGVSKVSNSVFAGNESGDIRTTSSSVSEVTYSLTQNEIEGDGNISGDAGLVDLKYCHLASPVGYYADGWFDGGVWSTTNFSSRGIDNGDFSAYGQEPSPNGSRLNMGAYGNTSVASKSLTASVLKVDGAPVAFGDVSPFYGEASHDAAVECSAPSTMKANGVTYSCTGYKVYVYDPATGGYGDEVASGNTMSYTFTPNSASTPLALVWQWQEAAYDVIAECVPSFAGSIVGGGEGCEAGKEVTLKAVANEGSLFVRWEGDLPEGVNAESTEISFTPTAPMSLQAVFINAHYVTVDASALGTGGSWASPTSLTNAFARALSGDTIMIKSGIYELDAQIAIADKVLTVKGGFLGTDNVTMDKDSTTILLSIGLKNKKSLRVFNISSSTIDFNNITITGGYNQNGAGLYASSSDLVFNTCVITNNDGSGTCYRGGGIYQSSGSIVIRDSLFAGNIFRNAGNDARGGGAAFYNVDAYITNTVFRGNLGWVGAYAAKGGGLAQEGGTLKIEDSLFDGNYSYNYSTVNTADRRCYGGALFLVNSEVEVLRTTFHRNFTWDTWSSGHQSTTEKSGGVVYQTGGTVLFERCVFDKNGVRASGGDAKDKGSITAASGTMRLKNVLIAGGKGNAVEALGSSAVVVLENCTIADYVKYDFGGNSSPYTRANGYALYSEGGTLNVTNSIISGCESGDYYRFNNAGTVDVNYTLLSSEDNIGLGTGNYAGEPLFVDKDHYHLASAAGTYTNGWFGGGQWIYTDTTSPAIDKASDKTPYLNEPQPNNYSANLGAYGNTEFAAKSVLGDDPVVENALRVFSYDPVIGASSATIYGDIGPEGKTAKITIVMDSEDKGTASVNDWANKYVIDSVSAWTKFKYDIDNLSGSNTYRIYAEGNGETAWSSPAVSFVMSQKATLDTPALSEVMRKQARIKGTLLNDGGADTTLYFEYWIEDAEPVSVVINNSEVVAVGFEYDVMLTGLEPGTTYSYKVIARNSVGDTEAVGTFTTSAATAQNWFITRDACGLADGTSFANGTASFSAFVENCESGDTVYLESGEFLIGSQINLDGKENITFIGGCNKDDYTVQDGITTIGRDPTVATLRHFKINNSTAAFSKIIFKNGYVGDGNAIHSTSSDLVFTNCTFDNNCYGSGSGSAIYFTGGKLSLVGSAFNKNRSTGNESKGGAIYASAAELYIDKSTFTTNYLRAQWYGMSGGAIYLTKSKAVVKDSYFAGNAIAQNDWYTQNYGHQHTGGNRRAEGGTFFLANSSELDIMDSTFIEGFVGYITTSATCTDKVGGILFVDGNSKAVINRTAFYKTGVHGGLLFGTGQNITRIVKGDDKGSLTVCQGSLYMTNVVMSACKGNGVETLTSSAYAEVVNCTFTGFIGDAITGYPYSEYTAYALYQQGGTINVKNSILWGNKNGNYYNHNDGGTMMAEYTLSQDPMIEGEGNICEDPLFYDTKYCHLRSFAGVYTGDWFGDKGAWIKTRKNNSPAIDAGDPDSDKSNEPKPWGPRINLGAYGNTDKASKSWISLPTMMILQ